LPEVAPGNRRSRSSPIGTAEERARGGHGEIGGETHRNTLIGRLQGDCRALTGVGGNAAGFLRRTKNRSRSVDHGDAPNE
jgi:hypothetical protein